MKRAPLVALLALLALVLSAAGCQRETTVEAPPPRPVRAAIAEKRGLGQSVVLTGQIPAEKETALAFRIGGRIIERQADVGQHVEPDQVLAMLDPQNEFNNLRSARAALSAAESLEKDANQFQPQETLLERGLHDAGSVRSGAAAYRTARAAVDVSGIMTARGSESSEVVQAGQMVGRPRFGMGRRLRCAGAGDPFRAGGRRNRDRSG
jgi:membrane fusion protein, multidrug efflux system